VRVVNFKIVILVFCDVVSQLFLLKVVRSGTLDLVITFLSLALVLAAIIKKTSSE
jgi:hypothetical protein